VKAVINDHTSIPPMVNAMTVDVEDYFHVSAFEQVINKSDWDSLELRVERNTFRLLELFELHQVKSTFFTLGWVAEKCPNLIKTIVEQGHELASHGYSHQRVLGMNHEEFKRDVLQSKTILEDISGVAVEGYRAPSFSVKDENTWIYSVLAELGFTYSSSTYPIEHDLYGVPDWPRFKYQRPEGITEIPIPTLRNNNINTGIGGGGYFRLYPYWMSRRRINRFLREEKQPYSFYFHPWEIDSDQPKIDNASFKSKIRHYINISRMEGKVIKLLKDYQWDTMKNIYMKG